MSRIGLFVHSTDPILQAGVVAQLRGRSEVDVVDDIDAADVALLAADDVDDETTMLTKGMQRNGCPRVVLVLSHLDEPGLLAGAEAGACGFLRRGEAAPERLVALVEAAAGGNGAVPADLVGRLLAHVNQLEGRGPFPLGLSLAGLSAREVEVLKLVAEGLETADIAKRLCYSERTVKGVIHEITTRLQLRNRAHAVAYAVRQGLI